MSLFPAKQQLILSIAPQQYRRVCAKIDDTKNKGEQPELRHLLYKQHMQGLLFQSFMGCGVVTYFGLFLFWSVRRISLQHYSLQKFKNMFILSPSIDKRAVLINKRRRTLQRLTYTLCYISSLGSLLGLYNLGKATKRLLLDEIPFQEQIEKELFL